jgi:hypothetical protein
MDLVRNVYYWFVVCDGRVCLEVVRLQLVQVHVGFIRRTLRP